MKINRVIAGLAGAGALTGGAADNPVILALSVVFLALGHALDRDADGIPDFLEKIRAKRRRRRAERDRARQFPR